MCFRLNEMNFNKIDTFYNSINIIKIRNINEIKDSFILVENIFHKNFFMHLYL